MYLLVEIYMSIYVFEYRGSARVGVLKLGLFFEVRTPKN